MYDAIVLAGGRGSRLGGVDKSALDVGGVTLLQRVLTATSNAQTTIVVGPLRELPYGVLGAAEDPPGGGPVAGLAAGLELVEATLVVVLACDLPFITATVVERLVDALTNDRDEDADGAQLIDEEGRQQPLAAVYRTARLRAAIAVLDEPSGTPMRHVAGRLIMLDIETDEGLAWDCDTWADVSRARARVATHQEEKA